jgi:predicted lipid-binding transport protein (Tim44 family)
VVEGDKITQTQQKTCESFWDSHFWSFTMGMMAAGLGVGYGSVGGIVGALAGFLSGLTFTGLAYLLYKVSRW